MDKDIQRGLNDRIYERRKAAALELEAQIRNCVANKDFDKISAIIDELCRDFAYAVHLPNARNGGLIGLAAAAIALGQNEVSPYLDDIVQPVLACFGDQESRVRYYACESMYNIAKVAKGEILVYFNEIFDALCRLTADTDASVKNGADLLDRLIKDIAAEKAATYVSVMHRPPSPLQQPSTDDPSKPVELPLHETTYPTAFSLKRFMPLLTERMYVINPFTRMFLVSWITLLDSIPELELISYLPEFLGGLLNFLSDPNSDVRNATQFAIEEFLSEIERISRVKRSLNDQDLARIEFADEEDPFGPPTSEIAVVNDDEDDVSTVFTNAEGNKLKDGVIVVGQDIQIDYSRIIDILISNLDSSVEDIQLTVLHWLNSFFTMVPEEIVHCVPRFLSLLLPTLSSDIELLRDTAKQVNLNLLDLCTGTSQTSKKLLDILDFPAVVNSLTLTFLNEKEATRIAALDWLIELHKASPQSLITSNETTIPALLKTLSDPSDHVVTRDLILLAEVSRTSTDEHFIEFLKHIISLFSSDRKLVENRGSLIIRQLCVNLDPERVLKSMASLLETTEDLSFAYVMIQNLNIYLATLPEFHDLRVKLRTVGSGTADEQAVSLFVTLFRSWSHNAVAALTLCLLAQAYQPAYELLLSFVDLEVTVSLLIQVDKLVQMLESPIFSRLRLQLLEPENNPYLYKCLYGLLMLLPQSSAFATLRNRLNSVAVLANFRTSADAADSKQLASGGLLGTGDNTIPWSHLLENFRKVQKEHEERRRSLAAANGYSHTAEFESAQHEEKKP
ncbi:hypothetical protein CANCADRAFT_29826 [Tortispora caseinolytica NRRL Y-17796]|uniref:Vacuolar protein 14 C-terminal Fig4-binding domain-containing protein n=1 Tax=Tortispora caseinolytica NRRL Y-17796 TaxID=767744 RepID=A0A1E4T9I4_9ASCO|nr:hypothetical protein CANCADRAFT_29826 [Tortispora caseinolytica NRRL Y-17796]